MEVRDAPIELGRFVTHAPVTASLIHFRLTLDTPLTRTPNFRSPPTTVP